MPRHGRGASQCLEQRADGTLVRRLTLPFYAGAYGSVHELSNGNWLTINGTAGEVYELSPDASEVYMRLKYNVSEYIPWLKSYRSILYRAYPVGR